MDELKCFERNVLPCICKPLLKMEAPHPLKSCSPIIITWCQNPEHHNLCNNGVSAYGASIKCPFLCAADWNSNRDCNTEYGRPFVILNIHCLSVILRDRYT